MYSFMRNLQTKQYVERHIYWGFFSSFDNSFIVSLAITQT